MKSTGCRSIVIHCMDEMFRRKNNEGMSGADQIESLHGPYALLAFPGGVKSLTESAPTGFTECMLASIRMGIELKEPENIVLIQHCRCLAYGHIATSTIEEQIEFHTTQLHLASKKIRGVMSSLIAGRELYGYVYDGEQLHEAKRPSVLTELSTTRN